jgi:hypothetical protein
MFFLIFSKPTFDDIGETLLLGRETMMIAVVVVVLLFFLFYSQIKQEKKEI